MSADFLVASLPALSPDGPAPFTAAAFADRCREQLGERHAAGIAAVMAADAGADPGAGASHPLARKWLDLDTQMRNAMARERARALATDAARHLRRADGCALFWQARIASAFQERDPMKRDRLLDIARWDAAGELTPAGSPLSVGAAFTYAVRLAISIRRSRISVEGGNAVFDRMTGAPAPRS